MSLVITYPLPQVALFEFETQKELTLTFFRVQEFYESPFGYIRGSYLSFAELVEEYMNEKGEISYFSEWTGFNVPIEVVVRWVALAGESQLSYHERQLLSFGEVPKYIIGALSRDESTIKHELAHALYSINPEYKAKVTEVIDALKKAQPTDYESLRTTLLMSGYPLHVLSDEINAYLVEANPKELDDIEVTRAVRQWVGHFQLLYNKYSTLS